MFNRFTERAQRVILLAQEEAKRLNHDYLGTEHLLLGLVALSEGVAAVALNNLGIDLKKLRQEIEKTIGVGENILLLGEIPFTPRAKRVLELSVEEAQNMGHNYVGTEHILLGLIKEGEGVAAKVLESLGATLDRVRTEIISLLGEEGEPSQPESSGPSPMMDMPESQATKIKIRGKSSTPTLDSFGRDLTVMAKEGRLDPVIGREKEIERVIQILCRRTKNNPALIGEPGVGKTAIVEGLAQCIAGNNVPEILLNKRVLTLDLAGVVAGTKYRGEFEQRLKLIVEEIRRAKNSIILFIDELHTVVGAGAAEGAIDASNMLKPALARGELQCIGATTLNEYRKYIEHDAALERRFQSVMVEPATVEEAKSVLKGLRDKYEAHHRVKITDEAIDAAAELSDRYIADRNLPDKAIDCIDEASARVRLKNTTLPPDLKNIEEEIEEVGKEKKSATTGQEFEKAAKLRDKERELKTKLEEIKKEWEQKRIQKEPVVTAEDIAYVVSKWTGVPVEKLTEKESEKLIKMEEYLHKRVIAQDEALRVVSQAVRRSRTGLKDPKRPIGSFIFLGPTGVGKTELGRALAEFLFGNEEAMIRIDMSEYMEKFSVSRLIGAPPGYVGYEEGGQLTEQVRRRPYSVVLLDEIEKAHPDVFNILLQVMDDGQLSDNLGHTVNFKNTVIIMTSNIGAREIREGRALGFQATEEKEKTYNQMKNIVIEEMKKIFNPEFLNRVDEIVVFHALDKEEMRQIVDLMLGQVIGRLKEQDVSLEVTKEAREFLLEKGFDPAFGARPLRRAIQRYLEDALASEILSKQQLRGKLITVDVAETKEKLIFKEKESKEG
ncbi:MAG: ATP-dependent Clp protease ATP-binding subunit [bacterium]